LIPDRVNTEGLVKLCELAKKHGVNNIVEVGVWAGTGTEVFANYFKKVYAVDTWQVYKNTMTERYDVKKAESLFDEKCIKYKNIIKIKMDSVIASIKLEGIFGMVYLDTYHDEATIQRDIRAWKDKVRQGGILSGHDYHEKYPGVVKTVNNYFKNIITFSDTSWAVIYGT
jgi:predicted O-methyltransferase YrrM